MTEFELKVELVKSLESNLKSLIKKSEDILNTIENEGIDGNYSINSDVLDLAQRVHSSSALMGYMKNFNLELKRKNKKKSKK